MEKKIDNTNAETTDKKLIISDVINMVCERCGHENTEQFIKYFTYCEKCGLNMKQTCL